MYDWFFAALIVFLASALQASTGFGFAIMATPFLLMVFDSRDCIQISIFLSLFIALVLTPKIRHEINHSLMKRLTFGSVVGVFLGIFFFAYVSLEILKASVSVVILVIGSFLLYKWMKANQKGTQQAILEDAEERTSDQLDKDSGQKGELFVGFLSGALTTSLGMPGVPLAIYFSAKNIKKEVIRSTTLAFFIGVYLISIVLQIFTVKVSLNVLLISLYLIPAAGAGIFLGNILFEKLDQSKFQLIVNLILLFTGAQMFYKTLLV